MDSLWNLTEGRWNLPWPQRVSQHDVVYLSPPDDPMQGLPVGNGDLGALVWTEGRRVHLAVNKVDTWDDGLEGSVESWDAKTEEKQTSLRACGRITLDFGLPMWDALFLADFTGRIGLADATATLRAESPFGTAEIRTYVSRPHNVLVLHAQTETAEAVGQRVVLERIGSRTFAHWYSQVNRDPAIGLGGTTTAIENGRLILRQQLNAINFVVAMALVAETPSPPVVERLHNRAGQYAVPPARTICYTLYLSVVTSENATDPLAEANARLDRAITDGEAVVHQQHAADWQAFWLRSHVHLSDPYVTAIWHTTLYLAASCSRGASPPHFCNGLWNPTHDFVPWNFYLEWNIQWLVWMLHPAGAADLAAPYLDYRFKQLARAKLDARSEFKADGAFYSDISNGRGHQQTGAHVRAVGLMIALNFWRHYQFTGDLAFLKNRGYPVMRDVTIFMLTQMTLGADGKYHPAPDTAYEGSAILEDVITSLALIRALFPVVIEAAKLVGADDLPRERLGEVLRHLADYHFEALPANEYAATDAGKRHVCGVGKGQPVLSDHVPAAGFYTGQGRWLRSRHGDGSADGYGIPDAELCPVFPAGVIGIKDKGSDLYNALVTFARFHPVLESRTTPAAGAAPDVGDGLCMGWCPAAIACARLGLKDETLAMIRDQIKAWQLYPQGLGHYGPHGINTEDQHDYYRTNTVRDAADMEKTFPFRTWPFRHFDHEAMPIVTTAVNEMLLQCHEGIVRVCPAVPDDLEVAFTLLARGGFAISTEKCQGKLHWIHVESRLGQTLVLENPWPGATDLYLWSGMEKSPRTLGLTDNGTVVLETRQGGRYLIGTDERLVANWRETTSTAQRNELPMQLGPAWLGKPRMF